MKYKLFMLLMILCLLFSISSISANDLNDGELELTDNLEIQENSQLSENSVESLQNTVYGNDVVKVFKNDTQYLATFTDGEGNYLKNGTTVRFDINDVYYDRQVGENGLVKLNINLPQGKYIINTTNLVTNQSITNSIEVISRIVENNQLTKYYGGNQPYSVKVLGTDGNPVGEGNEVTFNINGVFYIAKTNGQGIANLDIDFLPGGYVVTAEYCGCRVSNYIRILSTLITRDLSMTCRDGSQFVATLYDSQGDLLSNETVQFSVNGVSYNRTTDEMGQAKLNINLDENVYDITSSYGDIELTNKINIAPNFKKPLLLLGRIGTYEELTNKINHLSSGEVLTLDMDYAFEDTGRNVFEVVNGKVTVVEKYSRGIDITTDNITIDGNGHTIDGKSKATFFNVLANNVTIKNLNFVNGHDISNFRAGSVFWGMEYTESPLRWAGDYGIISDCTFLNNMGFIGGAISWTGNNGTICNSYFINNTARGVGGAIYVNASNHSIFNTTFSNCHSLLTGEVLYYDRMRGNCSLESVDFGNGTYIDGRVSNIDLNYLYYAYYSNVADEFYNLVHVLFLISNCNGSTFYFDENTAIRYNFNGTDFVLTFNKNLDDDIIFSKDYYFTNITCWNDVFDNLFESNFKNKFILVKNFYVTLNDLLNSYNTARTLTSDVLTPYLQYCEGASGYDLTLTLNVIFPALVYIHSNQGWVIKNSGFNIVSINGNGATVYAAAKSSEEYTWATVDENCIFTVNDLEIESFNTGVYNNGGYCIFNNVNFTNNHKDYWIDPDYGAAILNMGVFICNKCSFQNNYAKHGGAIFNQGNLILDECTFSRNHAYGKGNDTCNANGGVLLKDGNHITENQGGIVFVKEISTVWKVFIRIVSYALSFVVGFTVGFITANPVIGAVVGGLVGAGLGLGGASLIITFSYDMKMSRAALALEMSITSAALGAVGGIIGGFVAPTPAQIELNGMIAQGNPPVNPEIAEFINAGNEVVGYNAGVDASFVSEFSEYASEAVSEAGSVISNIV